MKAPYISEGTPQTMWVGNLLVCTGGYLAGVLITMFAVWLLNTLSLIPQGKMPEKPRRWSDS